MSRRPAIVLACEASARAGTGHLSRLMGLGSMLMARGDVHVAVSADAAAFEQVRAAGLTPADRAELAALVGRVEPAWVLFDETGDAALLQAVRRGFSPVRVAVTEYWRLREAAVDLAVVPFEPYDDLAPMRAGRMLTGFGYLFMRPEVAARHRPAPSPRPVLQRLVVSFGSVDPTDHTAAVLRGLAASDLGSCVVDVVLGRFTRDAAAAQVRSLAARDARLRVSVSPPDFVDRLHDADLVVCAGGMTLAESACFGVPALCWPHHAAEARFAAIFERAGAARRLDGEAGVAAAVEQLAGPGVRRHMALAGTKLVDGRGSERVAGVLLDGLDR